MNMKKRKTDGNRANILYPIRALRLPALNPNSINATVKEGLGCSKRVVRFAETENVDILDASPIRFQRKQASRSDEPSTSEFASFKKLKDDAGQRLRHRTLNSEPKNSRTSSITQSRAGDFVLQEKSGISSNSHDYMLHHKAAPPDNSGALRTPAPNGLSEESGFAKTDNSMTMREIPSRRKISATLEPYVLASESPGVARPGELFYRKRQRLRQWVTEVSYPEINDLSCNRYDRVSMMLNRLFPVRDPKLTSDEDKSLGSLEHETCSRKHLNLAEKNLAQFEYGRSSDVSLASCWRGIPSHRDPSNIHFSTGRSHVPCLNYENRELDYGNWGRVPQSSDGRNVYDSRQLKEWDEACFPTECSSARSPHSLLLGWDFEKEGEESNSYSGMWRSRGTEECSSTLSLWCDDRRKDPGDRFCVRGLRTPSMVSYYHQNLPAGRISELPHSGSFSRKYDKTAILEDTRLPLENEDNSEWHCPQDQRWCLGNITNEDRYAGNIETCSTTSWFHFDSPQKCLPWNGFSKPLAPDVWVESRDVIFHQDIFNHLRADKENVDGRWSCYSHEKETPLPLLLDKSHWHVGGEDGYC